MIQPSETEIEIAFAILGRLISRGNDPRMDGAGKLHFGGPVTQHELDWCKAHRGAYLAALVGAGRYEQGTLDRIYEITEGTGE